jgi:hypothetical protein
MGKAEGIIQFSGGKEPSIGGDGDIVKIQTDFWVELEPQRHTSAITRHPLGASSMVPPLIVNRRYCWGSIADILVRSSFNQQQTLLILSPALFYLSLLLRNTLDYLMRAHLSQT